MWNKAVVVAAMVGLGATQAAAQAPVDPPPEIGTLKGVPVPEPAGLGNFVRDRKAAVALGKALFWDQQVGSDGQACASCHFHAGADSRVKNQLNPGLAGAVPDRQFSHPLASGGAGGPNYALVAKDFPFHQLGDPLDRNSTVIFDTNDTVSSQGTFAGLFQAVSQLDPIDSCGTPDRTIFQVGGVATRKVEPRNTPTMINAAFNYRNFWDGRANNTFNGVSPFGRRDLRARIQELQANGTLAAVVVELENSSLASQAVGPPPNDNEMSCTNRTMVDVGHKLLGRFPLVQQAVAPGDSVLAALRRPFGKGLTLTYQQLVERAFQPRYWSASQPVVVGGVKVSQAEANFSLFWGLAIQLYEETLVSDDAPIDRYFAGDASALTDQEQRGLNIFLGKGKCGACHDGPELTGAASQLQAEAQEGGLIERMVMGDGFVALYDNGFYNTGVRPTSDDLGVGGVDPFGNPLSFARQFQHQLTGQKVFDRFAVDPCSFAVDPCVAVTDPGAREAVDGAFKTPGLRNVELTGPYFHNGGTATLEQVVAFYNRGGDRRGEDGNDTTGFGAHRSNLDPDIEVLGLTDQEAADLAAFLKRPLTDDRVRWEKAPFDHPALTIFDGAKGDDASVVEGVDHKAVDAQVVIPAVGASGRSIEQGPLLPFLL